MFRAKTVLVLGAGASVEVGLPVGADLLKEIVELTHISYSGGRMHSGDLVISEALKIILDEGHEVALYNDHLKAGWQLGASAKQALSIDNVIEALEDSKVELVGKLGITRAILTAEKASSFFQKDPNHHDRIDLDVFEDTWYSSFSKLLTENIRKSEIKEIFNNLEIINFNYDRCLEHYLPFSIGNYYGINPEEVRQLMTGLVIHRPYGMAGKLPWQAGEAQSVKFGSGSAQQVASVAQQIRTFTESVEEGSELQAIKNCISRADRVVFLGFAFHRQNVKLIESYSKPNAQFLATAYKISKSDKAVIEDELSKAFCDDKGRLLELEQIGLADLTCREFFGEYWRTLTAEPLEEPHGLVEAIKNLT